MKCIVFVLPLRLIAALLVLLGLAACETQGPYRTSPASPPQFANLVSPDMRIVAADGSWVMEQGEPFVPPRYVDTDWDNRTKIENRSVRSSAFSPSSYLDNSQRLQNGTLDVKVELADGTSLNGKLIFFGVRHNTDDSSARRMWTVAIPDQYLQVARSGNVAMVYQPYRQRGQDYDVVSWIMWISSMPL